MLLCDIGSFLEQYAPCHVSANTINECMENLCRQNEPFLARDDRGLYYWLSTSCSPKVRATSPAGENSEAIAPLQKIIDSILEQRSFVPDTRAAHNPVVYNHTEECSLHPSSVFGWTYQTDTMVPIRGRASDDDHAILVEFCRIMNEDPRRMWIYGLSHVHSAISVYHLSRSHSVGTHSFDFRENPAHLVELILSFAFATTVQLGIDPFVHQSTSLVDQTPRSYVYEVPSAVVGAPAIFYKTVGCLYQERRTFVEGRTTRIWEVTQVGSADGLNQVIPEQRAILKDVWLDADAPTEAENLQAIFNAVENFIEAGLKSRIAAQFEKDPDFDCNPATMKRLLGCFIDTDERFKHFDDDFRKRLRDHLTDKKYRSLFVTHTHSWQGRLSRQGSVNSRRPRPAANNSKVDVADSRAPTEAGKSISRRQSRFVYKEVCADLRAVGTLGNLMDVIDQAIDALRILYCAGWVHRDISKGNLLVVEEKPGKWKLKMTDFELSKQSGYGDGCVGTPYFIPHEVLNAEYLLNGHRDCTEQRSLAVRFKLPLGSPEYERLKDINKDFCERIELLPGNSTPHIPEHGASVRHNFQHDLESLWWVVHYCITSWVDHLPSQDYAEEIFMKSLHPSTKRELVFRHNFKSRGGRSLHPKLKPLFPDFMESLRAAMYEEYVAREAFGQLGLPSSYAYIHNFFARQFQELLQHGDNDWKDIPLVSSSQAITPPARTERGLERAEVRIRNKKPDRARR